MPAPRKYRIDVHVIRFENTLRIDYGVRFERYDPETATLFVHGHQKDLTIAPELIRETISSLLDKQSREIFPGVEWVCVTYHPQPVELTVPLRTLALEPA